MLRLAALPALLLLAAAVQAKPNPGPFEKIAVIHLKDDSDEQIDPSVKVSVLRRIEDARTWGADCVVFDIESYGGAVNSSKETADEILALGSEIHTIAYIHRKAISGAAMISISCQEIVMSEIGQIGDSQAIFLTAEGVQIAPEKFQSVVAGDFRKYAQRNGYPVPVCEAMVRQNMGVVRYKKPVDPGNPDAGFEWAYYRSDDPTALPTWAEQEEQFLTDQQTVVREGELAVFSAAEAVEYGLCSRIENSLKGLLDSLRTETTEVRSYRWSWAESTSRWLLGMRVWLFLFGAVFGYIAFKTPGTGVPELLAVLCFGLFFGASSIAGFSGALEVILFFAGVLLILVELFVLPGFGVPGFLGLALILTSIGLAAMPPGPPGELPGADPGFYLLPVARDFIFGTLGAMVVAFVIARHLPQIPLLRGLALEGPPAGARRAAVETPTLAPGATGVAQTKLRPSGRARFGGEERDVVAEGAWVQEGTRVTVVAIHGSVVVVRPETPS